MAALGFTLAGAGPPDHPGDARRRAAGRRTSPSGCSTSGVYVIGFSFPVVPRGQARIRTQMSAAHAPEDLAAAVAAFAEVGPRARGDPMSDRMRALVKARPEPGLWMEEVPVPEPGPNDVLIKVREERDLRHRRAHLELGRLGGGDGAGADGGRPRVRRRGSPTTGAAVTRFRPGERVSGEGHIVCGFCRNCRAGRGHLCRNTARRRRAPARLVRRVPLHPRAQRRADPRRHPRRDRGDLRPVRQRRAHRAQLRPRRRGRARHRRRADRHHGRAGRQAGGRAQGGDHRHQPLPARRSRARMGVDHVVDAAREDLARRDARHRHARGLRRRPRDVGRGAGLPRHDRQDEQRRQDRHPRHRARRPSRSTGTR